MEQSLKALISAEINEAVKSMLATSIANQQKAKALMQEADVLHNKATRMLWCDETNSHDFDEVPGSGRMGSRFEEKCKHCGWIHTS